MRRGRGPDLKGLMVRDGLDRQFFKDRLRVEQGGSLREPRNLSPPIRRERKDREVSWEVFPTAKFQDPS